MSLTTFAIILLAPFAAAARDELPVVVHEFHEDMMNWDNVTDVVVTDGYPPYPRAEEEGPDPMSNSDGVVNIVPAFFAVAECCLLLLMWTMWTIILVELIGGLIRFTELSYLGSIRPQNGIQVIQPNNGMWYRHRG